MIKPALHHVTMKTGRLAEMIDWYTAVIGGECNFRADEVAWMTNDAANHRIAFLAHKAIVDDDERPNHSGMHHTAFEYESFEHLMESWKRLNELGIQPAFSLDHGLTCSIYYRDPDHNYVELQSDNFGDWAKSTEFMRNSVDFASNPIGSFFEPAQVHAAHLTGMPFPELQRRMRAGEFAPEQTPSIGMPA